MNRFNSANSCYHLVQYLLSSRLLIQKHQNSNTKNDNFTYFVLYGCETWSLTLRQEHRLRVLENRVLRRIFGPKRDKVTGMEKTTQRGT